MRADKAPSVLDRAPILFGATGNFTDIGDEPIAIRTISAVELFENVQVGEMMTVEDQKVAAAHLWNAVNREADKLINGDEQVQQHERNNQGVNERGGENDERRRLQDLGRQSDL